MDFFSFLFAEMEALQKKMEAPQNYMEPPEKDIEPLCCSIICLKFREIILAF